MLKSSLLKNLHYKQVAMITEWRAARLADREKEAEAMLPAMLLTVNAIAGAIGHTG